MAKIERFRKISTVEVIGTQKFLGQTTIFEVEKTAIQETIKYPVTLKKHKLSNDILFKFKTYLADCRKTADIDSHNTDCDWRNKKKLREY